MQVPVDNLYAGEVGYIAASIKQVADARVGDTITLKKQVSEMTTKTYRK
jgi:translation elongation factor EF-4